MRVIVVSNMAPDSEHPERGSFVRDQVRALKRLDGIDLTLHEFAPGNYGAAAKDLRRKYKGEKFDIVHSHFGLTAVPALLVRGCRRSVTLHGRDLRNSKSRKATLAVLPSQQLIGLASPDLGDMLPRIFQSKAVSLPVGVDLSRFGPMPRREARTKLGLDPAEEFVLFPYGPDRRVKRIDRAQALSDSVGVKLRTLGGVAPEQMRLWLNASSAVVITSEHEGFGLAAVEALACNVAVLATPTGAHAETVGSVAGCLCAEWDLDLWSSSLREILSQPDARVDGTSVANAHGNDHYATELASAWRTLLHV